MSNGSPDELASLVLAVYAHLNFRPPDGQFTILAGFILRTSKESKVISLGTGSKCLPAARLPKSGDALHDSHAEVLARRGAIRWFLEEIARSRSGNTPTYASPWLERDVRGKFIVRSDVKLDMYISTVPCGDASTRYLASFQDAEMAALKDSGIKSSEVSSQTTSRGRDNYSLYGVMRTKPGRADSPPTLSMSCSDKIAAWNILGLQGALASGLLAPVYIDRIIIGEVESSLQDTVHEDCARALYMRLRLITGLAVPYRLNEPRIEFTLIPFKHSRFAGHPPAASGCNDSLCWVADSPRPKEVLINGFRRGVSPKHRHNPKFRPILSKLSLYALYQDVASLVAGSTAGYGTYYQSKCQASEYQDAKKALKGLGGPFEGWVVSGESWEVFYVNQSFDSAAS